MVSNSLSDSSPNGFHAVSVNGALIGSGQIGKGIILDGTDDYVNLGEGNPGSTIGTSLESRMVLALYFLTRKRLLEPQAGKFMPVLQILKYTSGVAVLVQGVRMLYQVGQHQIGIMCQQIPC